MAKLPKNRRRVRPPDVKVMPGYRQVWRLVDGAVLNAMQFHSDYFSLLGRGRRARNGFVKRVTGAIIGHATEVARNRSGLPAGGRKA